MSNTVTEEVLAASRKLLTSIDSGNWAEYVKLCDETITCFEPEALGHLVAGLPFHEFYFKLPGNGTPRQSTMASPDVRVLSDTSAVVTYVRLTQKLDAQGAPVSVRAMETRVWQKQNGVWKHVHFHRTPC
jgi:calcium/calmodulin-dependent protein kinase (CaM kinase) II